MITICAVKLPLDKADVDEPQSWIAIPASAIQAIQWTEGEPGCVIKVQGCTYRTSESATRVLDLLSIPKEGRKE